ncbi:hypothetical protein Sjap_015279 [Stephania japonica]|uniref:non-specific serine/threonine protein kinase n=1 Tax=Stephania japonica TaxID=461633 RepID=A0AAP0NQN5_9MAGN
MRRSIGQPVNTPVDISFIDTAWLRSFYPKLEEYMKHVVNVTYVAALMIQACYHLYLFDSSHYSCFVMEYCPSDDLHDVRLRQPNRWFNVSSAKDHKPKNVPLHKDGNIMLSDFDLSLKCVSRFSHDGECL